MRFVSSYFSKFGHIPNLLLILIWLVEVGLSCVFQEWEVHGRHDYHIFIIGIVVRWEKRATELITSCFSCLTVGTVHLSGFYNDSSPLFEFYWDKLEAWKLIWMRYACACMLDGLALLVGVRETSLRSSWVVTHHCGHQISGNRTFVWNLSTWDEVIQLFHICGRGGEINDYILRCSPSNSLYDPLRIKDEFWCIIQMVISHVCRH